MEKPLSIEVQQVRVTTVVRSWTSYLIFTYGCDNPGVTAASIITETGVDARFTPSGSVAIRGMSRVGMIVDFPTHHTTPRDGSQYT